MMETICETLATIMQNFLIIWFISSYCGYKYSGFKKYFGFGLILAADCIFVSVIDKFLPYDGVLSLISICMYVIYSNICLKKNTYMHIFVSVFAMVIIYAVNGAIFFFISAITKIELLDLYSVFLMRRVFILIFCRIAEFSVFAFILHINRAYDLSKKEWLLFALSMLVTYLEIIAFNNSAMVEPAVTQYMLTATILTLAVNVLLYYFVLRINKETKRNSELKLLNMQYEGVKHREENLKNLYEGVNSLKHDLSKHLTAIKAKAEDSKDEEIVKYIDTIMDENIRNVQKVVSTDNEVLNAIINVRLEICNVKGIDVMVNIEDHAMDTVRDEDMAVLLGNIFDNAIEAAQETEEKYIELTIQKQRGYVSIYMENSFDGVFDIELKSKKHHKEEHGFGLKNVRKIVESYNGMMKCFPNEATFCCDILLENAQT